MGEVPLHEDERGLETANLAHIRQSRPVSGLAVRVKVLKTI